MHRAVRLVQAITLMGIATAQTSGCLTTPIDPNDPNVEQFKLLMPASVIEDPIAGDVVVATTDPLPGAIVLLEPEMGMSVRFRVTVARDNADPLVARWWINRPRPCLPTAQCGSHNEDTVAAPANGGRFRELSRQFSFVRGPEPLCYRVDLYLSPRFETEDYRKHVPVKAGDVAHVRWYVAVRGNQRLDFPTVDKCQDQQVTP